MTDTDIYQSLLHFVENNAWMLALVLLLLITVVFLMRGKIRNTWLNMRTRRQLKRLGLKQLSHFKCPDGLGGYFDIDRLVLRRDGISLIVIKQFAGSIFCAENIDEWTQMLEGKSYRFKNPLIDLDYQINALSECIPDVPIDGYLFFDHHASFPKGRPDRVISADDLPESLLRVKQQHAEKMIEKSWHQLREMANP